MATAILDAPNATITRADLADRIGIDAGEITRILNGTRITSPHVMDISRELGLAVTVADLLTEQEAKWLAVIRRLTSSQQAVILRVCAEMTGDIEDDGGE